MLKRYYYLLRCYCNIILLCILLFKWRDLPRTHTSAKPPPIVWVDIFNTKNNLPRYVLDYLKTGPMWYYFYITHHVIYYASYFIYSLDPIYETPHWIRNYVHAGTLLSYTGLTTPELGVRWLSILLGIPAYGYRPKLVELRLKNIPTRHIEVRRNVIIL